MIKTLQDKQVKEETIKILEYLTDSKDTEEILAVYLKNAFLRQDVLDNLTELLIGGAKQAIED